MSKQQLTDLFRRFNEKYQQKNNVRRGLLGRGLDSEATAQVQGRPGYYYVRNREDPRQVHQVLGGPVPDIPGWPVLIGSNPLQANISQIIDTDWHGLYGIPSFSGSVGQIGPHHQQHEYQQFDQVNIHKGQIRQLRVVPTAPTTGDVIVEGDEAVYLGPRLINLRDIDGYEPSPIPGVRRTIIENNQTGTTANTRWYLATLTDDPDIIFITGTAGTIGGLEPKKPSISLARDIGGFPLAYVKLRAGATTIEYSDIEDVRGLFAFPGAMRATGVFADDPGGFFTGSSVEAQLQELGFAKHQVKVSPNDATGSFLGVKLADGTNIFWDELNDGEFETLQPIFSGTLNSLTDVNVPNPASGTVLTYNGQNQWVAAHPNKLDRLTLNGKLTINGDTLISNGGTIVLGGHTLTIPTSGTAALREAANTFTADQTVQGNLAATGDVTIGGALMVGGNTLTVPASGTAALREAANTFTAGQTFAHNFTLVRDGASAGPDVFSYRDSRFLSRITFWGARGTLAAPGAVLANDILGRFGAVGRHASGWGEEVGLGGFVAEENFTSTAQGCYFFVQTTPAGSTTRAERLRVTGGGALLVGKTTGLTGAGDLDVAGNVRVSGNIGFYNTTPQAKPTVTGSRGGNAALASLLTALATLGLITNNSTA